MNVLPRTSSRLLQAVVVFLAVGCVAVSISNGLQFLRAEYWPNAAIAVFCAFLAVGLWLMKSWARRVMVFVLWFLIIVIPVGVINPFAAMDAYGLDPPSVWVLVARVYPFVGLGIYVLHVLGKYKGEFSRAPATELAIQSDAVEPRRLT